MASNVVKKYCTKCRGKERLVAVVCNKCQQVFCATCIVEHQQELVTQIDNVNREYDVLKQELNEKYDTHVILSNINTWEKESIRRIQAAAEAARIDLQKWTLRKTNEIKPLLDKMTDELTTSRELHDYSEMNLKEWIQQLKELQEIMNYSSTIDIVNEINETSIIHLIKMKENHHHQQSSTVVPERFDKAIGSIELSPHGLRASHLDHIGSFGSACGTNLYSSGKHYIGFKIVGNWGLYFFSGIITSLQEIVPHSSETPSAYGWWDFDGRISNGQGARFGRNDFIQENDEFTFTLNCDKRQIDLEHHRTNSHVHLSVDLQVCPFPWKFIIGFDWRGGSVQILH